MKLHGSTKIVGAGLAIVFAVASLSLPAFAREYVQDGAALFTASTVSSLDAKIGDFQRQTGKEVVVVTVPSLGGETPQAAAEKVFAQQQVNGVLIFLAKAEKKDGIIGDRASRTFFPNGSFDSVRQAMRGYFRTGNFDEGIATGVDLVLNDYRGHERSLGGAGVERQRRLAPTTNSSSLGGGMSLFWLILILIAGFLIIRAIFRAMSRPKMMPPGYGGQPGGYNQGPGYGPGMGPMGGGMMGGGGGGFFSGLLGGLGGAFLGNELFGRHDNGGFGGDQAGFVGGDSGQVADAGGWQSDAGQADMSGASFGDYGSSGGYDSGGGGGFDSGSGGGDSGGGW
ncbi:MAG: hypothetical protein NVS2B3_18890 [Vulcanimicrobiaceae bacterium]